MKKIAILSYHSGRVNRGVESWAKEVQMHLASFETTIFSRLDVYNPLIYLSADVVVSTGGRLEVLICRLMTWIRRKPMVVFGHSGPGADDKWNLWCCPSIFVAFSSSQAEWVVRHKLPWTKIKVIPHAVDTDAFRPATKNPQNNIILCVAANTPNKRINLVKQAVSLIPGVEFMAVGPGNPKQVPFEQMPLIYPKARVFCFVPEPWEAFGLVFLEALACNLPVVTVNDPVRQEIVGNAGILVNNPENAQELSTAIKTALNRDWEDIPREQAEKFSWDKISNEYEKLFNSL